MRPRAKKSKSEQAKAEAEFISKNSCRVDLLLLAGKIRKLAGLSADHITGRTFLNAIIAADLLDRLSERWPCVITTDFPQLERFVTAVVRSLNKGAAK